MSLYAKGLLRDGAMVSGYLGDPRTIAGAMRGAGRAIIAFRTEP